MNYQVGDYISAPETVYLRIIAAVEGALEIYGLCNIRNPLGIQWMSIDQIKAEGYQKGAPNLNEFANARVGDHVKCGGDYIRILARVGDAILLSQAENKGIKAMLGFMENIEHVSGEQIVSDQDRKHLREHTTVKHTQNAVGDWCDVTTMALMNWRLVTE